MARDSGRSVQRAAATGGGRTYRGQVPVNWYAGLILIVILGLISVVFARYEYQRPAAATPTAQPAVGTTWYAGMSFYTCGRTEAPVPASTNTAAVGLTTSGNGVIVLAPKKATEAGRNATLGRFVADYPGMAVTSTKVGYPGQPVLTSGEACPAGTPDAGKKGVVLVRYWPHVTVKSPGTPVGDPTSLRLGNNSLVTIGFAPAGTTIPRPPPSVELAVLRAASQTTTSTSLPTTATLPPGASTTLPATATTVPVTKGPATPTTVGPHAATPASTTPTTAAR